VVTSDQLVAAYDFCQQLAASHYENFPVASKLLPKRLRQPINVIYAFSRTADDFADEGDADQLTRLNQLDEYSQHLDQIEDNDYTGDNPIFIALADVIEQHQLPMSLFHDLLSAFKQDVVKSRYNNFEEVLDYCTRSANPVGRLLLHLMHQTSEQQLQQSDAICTALQLINFYQDIEQDLIESNRIYIPLDELAEAGIKETDVIHIENPKLVALIRNLYGRTQAIMERGLPLGASLNGRIGWEVRAMTLGGVKTLNALKAQPDEKLLSRPRLSKAKLLTVMLQSLNKYIYLSAARCQSH
jgi:squalene synthase HpnC